MTRRIIPVTDHALIRYIERGLGLDLEPLRLRIFETAGAALEAGCSSYSRDGLTYRMRDGLIVTVVCGDAPSSARREHSQRQGRSIRLRG